MARVITGAKAVIHLITSDAGDIPIALASGINITQENRLEEIPQLDTLEVAEYAENGHRCSFTVNFFKLLEVNAEFYGFDSPSLERLLIQPELTFRVIDDSSDANDGTETLYLMQGCKFEGGSGQVNAGGVWEGTWNFKARRGIGI